MNIYVFVRGVCGCKSNLPSLHLFLQVVILRQNIKLVRMVGGV